MQRVGGAALALSATSWLAGCGGTGALNDDNVDDNAVFNFALMLEYLEAEFYSYAVSGMGIETFGVPVTGDGDSGPTIGGSQVTFTIPNLAAVASEIAENERTHVLVLRNALGGEVTAKPTIDLNALGIGFANESEFLVLARAFEDVGVTAYYGAAPLLSSQSNLITAAGFLTAESMHAGNIRLFVANNGIATAPVDGKDIVPPPSGTEYFMLDPASALAIPRTAREVLDIILAGQQEEGGFFPDGLNGEITS